MILITTSSFLGTNTKKFSWWVVDNPGLIDLINDTRLDWDAIQFLERKTDPRLIIPHRYLVLTPRKVKFS